MRAKLIGILVLLIAASPLYAGYTPPKIDGVISDGEWTPYYLDSLASTWPYTDNNLHTWVDVYFAQDKDFYYVAFVADPTMDGWPLACTSDPYEAELRFVACGDPSAPVELADCDDAYDACTKPNTHLFLHMGGSTPTGQVNTGDCSGNPLSDPLPLQDMGIEAKYFGYADGCTAGDYSFRTELKIPKTLLSGAKKIQVGGYPWIHESYPMWAQEDLDGDGIACPCCRGTWMFIPVKVDIKPKNDNNCLNLGAESSVKVAILTTDDFDPTNTKTGVQCNTIRFLGVPPAQCRTEQADNDGRKDVVAYFRGRTLLKNGNIDCSATETEITGVTYDSIPVSGWDKICYLNTNPCP